MKIVVNVSLHTNDIHRKTLAHLVQVHAVLEGGHIVLDCANVGSDLNVESQLHHVERKQREISPLGNSLG